MEYTVEITLRTRRPLTEDTLVDVAELGGAVSGNPGDKHLETTLTVVAADIRQAGDKATEAVTARVAGTVVAIEVMTTDEADRRSTERLARPEVVGVGEIAERFGVSRQRVDQLRRRPDFPAPLAQLSSGPVWRARDLSTFELGWQRKGGRPKKTVDASQ